MSNIIRCDICLNTMKSTSEAVRSVYLYKRKLGQSSKEQDICKTCEKKILTFIDQLSFEADKKTNAIIDER